MRGLLILAPIVALAAQYALTNLPDARAGTILSLLAILLAGWGGTGLCLRPAEDQSAVSSESTVPSSTENVPAPVHLHQNLSIGIILGLAATVVLIGLALGVLLINQHTNLALSLWAAGVGILAMTGVGIGRAYNGQREHRSPGDRWLYGAAALAIFALALALRLAGLHTEFGGAQGDESMDVLDGLTFLHGGWQSPFMNDWSGNPGLRMVIVAWALRLFGVGVIPLRYTSVLAGMIGVLFFFLFARLLMPRWSALLATLLFAGARWQITFSRTGFPCIWTAALGAGCLYFLVRAYRARERQTGQPGAEIGDMILCGVLAGLCLQGYFAGRIIPIVLLVIFLCNWWYRRATRLALMSWVALALSTLLTWSPMLIYYRQTPGSLLWRAGGSPFILAANPQFNLFDPFYSAHPPTNLANTAALLWNQFGLYAGMFTFQGDLWARDNLPGAPMLDVITGVLFLVGLGYALAHWRQPAMLVLLSWLGLTILVGGVLTTDAPSSMRTLIAVTPIYLLAGSTLSLWLTELIAISRTWHGTWRGTWTSAWVESGVAVTRTIQLPNMGTRIGPLLRRGAMGCAFLVVGCALILNGHTYFVTYAQNHDFYEAYSPEDTTRARIIGALGPRYTTVIISDNSYHAGIMTLFAGNAARVDCSSNPLSCLPYPGAITPHIAYMLFPGHSYLLATIQKVYPRGQTRVVTGPFKNPICTLYLVSDPRQAHA